VGGFLENVHKIRISSSWWTKILELGVFSGKNIPVAVGTLLDPKRNSIKAKGLFEKRHTPLAQQGTSDPRDLTDANKR
jgi:hypothetical protein